MFEPLRLTRRPAAVIFDMDGLMLDTEPVAARAWSVAADELGIAFDRAVTQQMIGRNFADCRTLIREHHGGDYPVDTLMSGWHAAYDALIESEGLVVKEGLFELLDWLEAAAIPKAVATSTRRQRALAKLERVGIAQRFVTLVGGDEIPRGKPAPDIFLEVAARLSATPARASCSRTPSRACTARSPPGWRRSSFPTSTRRRRRCVRRGRSCCRRCTTSART